MVLMLETISGWQSVTYKVVHKKATKFHKLVPSSKQSPSFFMTASIYDRFSKFVYRQTQHKISIEVSIITDSITP